MNKGQLAEIFDVARKTVDAWVARGMPVVSKGGQTDAWEIDTRQAMDWYFKRGSGAAGDGLDVQQETARLKHAQANKTELEVEQLRGSLIPADVVEDRWQKYTARFRARILALPEAAAPRVVGETIQAAAATIREMANAALAELRDYDPRDYRPDTGDGPDRATGVTGGRAAAKSDGESVGRRKSSPKQRGKRRAGKVAD